MLVCDLLVGEQFWLVFLMAGQAVFRALAAVYGFVCVAAEIVDKIVDLVRAHARAVLDVLD